MPFQDVSSVEQRCNDMDSIRKILCVLGVYDVARELWMWCCRGVLFLRLRYRYHKTLVRIRKVYGQRKLRVLFVISDPSKWKCQHVYEKMLASREFDPYVAPTIMDIGFVEDRFQLEHVRKCRDFFKKKGARCVDVISEKGLQPQPLCVASPDLVIYQQPWGVARNQDPVAVSHYALTFYVPYYSPAFGSHFDQVGSSFHRSLYGNFLDNEHWVEYFKSVSFWDFWLAKMMPCGSPFREEIARSVEKISKENLVIYAPHWSFPQDGVNKNDVYSTFLKTGRYILDFAKRTSGVTWVFKPHPVLKDRLIQSGVWVQDEVEQYYAQWSAIGLVCEDGNYADLFARSRALITDSLSFLSEYLVVNRPLIRLEQDYEPNPWLPPAQGKLEGMYRVRTLQDLQRVLDLVVLKNEDPMKDIRAKVVRRMGYDRNEISSQMIDHLRRIVSS